MAAGAGIVALSLPACDAGAPRLGEGALDDNGGGTGTGGNTGGTGGTGGNGGNGGNGGGGADMAGKPPADMAGQPPADMAGKPPADMAQAQSCNTSMVNAGASSQYTVGGTPKYFSKADVFVVRDSNGLYAVSSICTHQGCTNNYQSGKFVCPCHSATFDLNGANPTYPAPSKTLAHYALCIDGSGTVYIDPNTTVSASQRY